MTFQVLFAILLTLPLLIPMVGEWFPLPFTLPGMWQLGLAACVQFGAGYTFYVSTFKGLLKKTIGMDFLVTLGTSAAFFSSAAVVLFQLNGHLYFETSAVLITLILVGRLLEEKSKQRATEGMQSLLKMQAKSARVKENGKEVEKPIEAIQMEECIIIKPGERVPVDGEVTGGKSHVDEAMLSGESAPVKKEAKESVYAGTVNQEGVLEIKVTKLGKETSLARIIELTQKAQQTKAPIQKKVDQIARFFVPCVVGVALITFCVWGFFLLNWNEAWTSGIAVLVIACPCALGLATPIVIKVACSLGAKEGVLIKDAETFEKVSQLQAFVVDKTGTLTEGKLTAQEIQSEDENFLQKAVSLTQNSDHPISKAITAYGEKSNASLEKGEAFHSHAGEGLSGTFQGKAYLLGSFRFFQTQKISLGKYQKQLEKDPRPLAALAEDGVCIGVIFLADQIKPGTKEAIETLKKMKKEIYLMSGDRQVVVDAIGKALGVDGVFAEVKPEEKAEQVQKLQSENKMTGMVGDGVNDAPALAAADAGFAIADGTDVAMENAAIGLMKSHLSNVVFALQLSEKALKKIKQNLFFAFFYNGIAIPLAAVGLLNPMIAGAAMALSSISVVLNALLLRTIPK